MPVLVALSQKLGQIIVSKGHRTLISGQQEWFRDTNHTALATAGTGDVLAGIIGALMAQGVPPEHAGACGVGVHSMASDIWLKKGASSRSMTAGDLINCVGAVYAHLGDK